MSFSDCVRCWPSISTSNFRISLWSKWSKENTNYKQYFADTLGILHQKILKIISYNCHQLRKLHSSFRKLHYLSSSSGKPPKYNNEINKLRCQWKLQASNVNKKHTIPFVVSKNMCANQFYRKILIDTRNWTKTRTMTARIV